MIDLIPAWVDGTLMPVEKLAVHQRGLRHKAVSVFVMQGDLLLLQRRALGKYHTPGLWANTCCTHPHWGEAGLDCATRRLRQELGITLPLHPAGATEYCADVGQGMTEHEVVDLFIGRAPQGLTLHPDPAEVMAVQWLSLPDLHRQIATDPSRFSPWLRIYLTENWDELARRFAELPT